MLLAQPQFASQEPCGTAPRRNVTNPLSRNQHWRADSDGCIGLHLMPGVAATGSGCGGCRGRGQHRRASLRDPLNRFISSNWPLQRVRSAWRRCCLWRFDMGCELPSFVGSNGRKSTLLAQPFMCVGSKMASPPRTRSGATKCAHCASSSVKLLGRHSYSLMSEEHRSHLMGSTGW
jgi:hypothetical protein